MMGKVFVFLADGFEEIEALSVVDVLRRASLKCDLCSIKDEFVRGTHNIIIQSDCIIDNIDQDEYDAIVLPGGLPGVNYLEDQIVVVDKNIITSRGPATALEFAFKILEELGYKDKAEEIKKDMLVDFYLDHSK